MLGLQLFLTAQFGNMVPWCKQQSSLLSRRHRASTVWGMETIRDTGNVFLVAGIGIGSH